MKTINTQNSAARNESPYSLRAFLKQLTITTSALLVTFLAAGCSSTKVSNHKPLESGLLPRPQQILVYEFVATPGEMPADFALASQVGGNAPAQTPQQIADGRKLGADIAAELVVQIRAMGMRTQVARPGMKPQLNDIVIRGCLLSIQEGNAAKRVGIGFGSGSSHLTTAVEGFQMTAQGLRKLGSGTVDAGGSKTPGAALGVAGFIATANPAGLIIGTGMKVYGETSGKSKVEGRAKATAKEIADVLEKRFKEQGWI